MCHRILKTIVDDALFVQPGMYISKDTFRSQASFLKKRFHVLPLAELVDRIESGRSIGGCCAITLDDGWRDNYTQAFPVLQDLQIPATIFLATSFIGTDRLFWPEEFSYYLLQPGLRAAEQKSEILTRFMRQVRGNAGKAQFLEDAILAMKALSPQAREEILSELRSLFPAPQPKRLLMNWEEAKEMQAGGLITFGSHSARHVILDQVSLEQAEEEIVSSREELENRLGVWPKFFAYPNGNYNDAIQRLLKVHGFKGAVTTRKGWVGKGVDLFEIPRIGIHEDISRSIPLFLARILLKWF